jgi:hypothetical protein
MSSEFCKTTFCRPDSSGTVAATASPALPVAGSDVSGRFRNSTFSDDLSNENFLARFRTLRSGQNNEANISKGLLTFSALSVDLGE